MLQPDIQGGQFRTAIHGKSLSGGALNGVQKLLRAHNLLSVQVKNGGCLA
jgi:hypothetical protein